MATENIPQGLTIVEENKRKLNVYGELFKQIFGVDLRKFMHPIFGFDVVAFDRQYLIPKFKYDEDKFSMNDIVRQNFGDAAVKMIQELI